MGKFPVTVTVFLFILVVCDALTASNNQGNDDIVADLTLNLPESDPETTTTTNRIFPYETIPEFQTESGSIIFSDPENSGSGSQIPQEKPERDTVSATITFVNFRPINRHRQPCRFHHLHHHRHHPFKRWGPRIEIPYYQDMILAGREEERGSNPVLRGVNHQNPAEWMKLRPDELVFPSRQHEEEKMKRKHQHDQEMQEGREKKGEDEHENHKAHTDGFVKMVRKFLKDQF